METKLLRIAELAKSDPKMKFTSLAHLLNEQSLVQCHHELPNKKATGVNGTTKEQYSENLKENIEDLVSRLKSKSYRPVPVRRMYIPKLNSNKKRPLGIPEHEDKIVQKGITKRFWCKDFIYLKEAYRFLVESGLKQQFQIIDG